MNPFGSDLWTCREQALKPNWAYHQ